MSMGFGSQPGLFGDLGLRVDRPRGEGAVDEMAIGIRAIAERFCLPKFLSINPFAFTAANQSQQFDLNTAAINSFVITVVTGTVSIWLGNNPSPTGVGLPHFQFGPGVSQQILLPPGGYVFTLQSTGGAASGVFTPMAL